MKLETNDPVLRIALTEMIEKHHCHTIILYGSRARGDFTSTSDYDLAGFRSDPTELRIARIENGHYLDGFIYSDIVSDEKLERFLKLHGGVALKEKEGFGTHLLKNVSNLHSQGPLKLPDHELEAQKIWVLKTLDRAKRGDLEGNFRRVWLLHEFLAYLFESSGRWYRGPKEAFMELKTLSPILYQCYEQALLPSATLESLEELIQCGLENPLQVFKI